MSSKHKKAIMYEFLVRLIIALVFIFGAFYIAKSLFRLSSASEESFNKLAELIDSVEEGKTQAMALIMDKGTAIAIFNKDETQIKFNIRSHTTARTSHEGPMDIKYTITDFMKKPKPPTCPEGSECICLCKKVKLDKNEYICLKSHCITIESNTLPLYDQCEGIYPCLDSSEGGSIFLRDVSVITSPRAKTIYVTGYNGFVAVCTKSPCPPEEIRKERIEVLINEVKDNYLYYKKDLIGIDPHGDKIFDLFYYVRDYKKDIFGIYFYEYNYGSAYELFEEDGKFKNFEETANDFEQKMKNRLEKGQIIKVLRSSENPEKDLKNFKPNLELKQDGTLKPITS